MSEWLREAMEADRYDDVDYASADISDVQDAYADYITSDVY